MKKLFIAATVAIVICTGCSSNAGMIDPEVRLAYEKGQDATATENLTKAYGSTINKNRKEGVKVPGIYSDYAVGLVKQDRRAEANSWFNKEMEAFPVSRGVVMQLKRDLIPEYQNNNEINLKYDEESEELNALPPAKRAAAEERASGVIDDGLPEEETEDATVTEEELPAEGEGSDDESHESVDDEDVRE